MVISKYKDMKTQEIANILYSYSKTDHTSDLIFKEIEPFIISNLEKFKPKEICTIFKSYIHKSTPSPALIAQIEYVIKSKYTEFNALDISSLFQSLAELNFPLKGEVWAKIQKSISKNIGRFTSADIARMYAGWRSEENQLNRGVRQRILKHTEYLVLEKRLKPHDGAVVREAIRSKEFFEYVSMDHKERTQRAEELVGKIRDESRFEKGMHSTDWFLALEEERKRLNLVTEEDVLIHVEKLLQKERYFP